MTSLPERRPIIRGEQVYLRPAERDDLPTFVRWFNDADVLRNLAMFAPMSDAAEAAWFDGMLAAQGKTDYHFVICLLADDRPIGTIGLHGISWKDGTADFGIAIGEKDEWNRGYATDALRAISDFGFGALRLERIGLYVYDGNDAARRVYQKAGFVHEGTIRNDRYEFGRLTSGDIMSILRDEWLAPPQPGG